MNLKNKKKYLPALGVIVLVVTFISLSYAFFQAQGGVGVSEDVHLLTHTLDSLAFSVSNNISIEATQDNFTNTDSNLSGTATATAVLIPNSKTGAATRNYYMYLAVAGNELGYSAANTNHDPEVMLQVFNGSNQLVTLTGLGTQKTIKGVTGYDITGVSGLIPLLDNHAITASSSTTTTETWRVVITYINLDVKQNENAGKEIVANLVVQEEEIKNPANVTVSGISSYSSCTDLYCALNELYGAI